MASPVPQYQMRVTWTLMMEKCLMDLMLVQKSLGNRVGHTFNKQAWTDMLSAFNAQFGTEYGIDALKVQYMNMWKQFIDVKNILEQHGFSWDHSQKMVMASDDIWDAYLKVYPDAQCFRKKVLINFTDLCLIFAYTVADGRYSRSSHDIDMDDDIQGVNIGNFPRETIEHAKSNWSLGMDQYIVKLMLDQIKKGNRSGKRFTKQAWKEMLALFNAKFSSQHGKTFLKRRYWKLFKYYVNVRSILERKGFYWDEKHHKIVADDGVWDIYIKAHPDMHWYMKKTFPNYQDLNLIYGSNVIDGHGSVSNQNKTFEDCILQGKDGEKMDSQTSPRNDDVGTCWIPAMDYCLIDLLQDQVLMGNKMGRHLTTEAWTEIIKLFNERFEAQCSKAIIHSRYKFLRRQYKGVKFLLKQTGFSWDETQEMVIAEDCVWDSYSRVNPDVLSYRYKSVPSYHKLCVIFMGENCNGRSGHRAHTLDIDSQCRVLTIREDDMCHANGDYSEAAWTPSMDRYFIDLMLELVHKRNKTDNFLDNQTLMDMVVMFNERFGLQFDQETLEDRHKSLRKLFNDVKNLHRRKRFSLVKTRQLVKENDNVLGAYVQEVPDARTCGAKPQPSYDDLFLIYGSSASDEKANHINIPSVTADWSPPMDRFFIDLILDHVRQGSMIDQRLSEHAWTDMVAKFRSAFGFQNDRDVLENRLRILRKRFNDMKILLDQSGFAWDECHQMIIADDDTWDAYVEEYPDALSYRSRTLHNYNDLFLIFGDSNNKGRNYYWSSSMAVSNYVQEPDIVRVETGRSSVKIVMNNNGLNGSIEGNSGSTPYPDAQSGISNSRRKRKSKLSISAPSRKVQKPMKDETKEDFGLRKEHVPIEIIVDALQAIPDMNDELFLEACKLLENDKKAKVFIAMDVNHRRNWLFRKLYR